MVSVNLKGRDISVDDETLKSMEVTVEKRVGRGERKWALLFNYPDGTEEYWIFDSHYEAATAMYMVSVVLEQKRRRDG